MFVPLISETCLSSNIEIYDFWIFKGFLSVLTYSKGIYNLFFYYIYTPFSAFTVRNRVPNVHTVYGKDVILPFYFFVYASILSL